MSMLGVCSNDCGSAAGSRLTRWAVRRAVWRCVRNERQNVDLPAPAGPVTSTA